MNNEVQRLFNAAKRVLGIQHPVEEFSQLENVDAKHIEGLLQGFGALFDLYNNLDKVPNAIRSNMQNTDDVKNVLQKLPTIDELISSGNTQTSAPERFHDFLRAVYEMKLMAKKGGELRKENPDADVLELDEKHPEVLLFHLEDGISNDGLAFATVLHLIEMYLNRVNEVLFKEKGFNTRKDWLTDMSMELMIANDALPSSQRNQNAHDLYVLVNEKLGWIKGYSHIHPVLLDAALLDSDESKGE